MAMSVSTRLEKAASRLSSKRKALTTVWCSVSKICSSPHPTWVSLCSFRVKRVSNLATAHVVSQQPNLSYFRNISTPAITKALNSSSELTLFLPVDSAWNTLDPYERLYLESEFSADDVLRILNMHAVVQKGVRWSESLEPSTSCAYDDDDVLCISLQLNHPSDHS